MTVNETSSENGISKFIKQIAAVLTAIAALIAAAYAVQSALSKFHQSPSQIESATGVATPATSRTAQTPGASLSPAPKTMEAEPPAAEIVRRFYAALALADGAAASGLVIPEKRGAGPFSPEAISNFYSSMRDPLRVTDIHSTDDGLIEVRYTYIFSNGKPCVGAAIVKTVMRDHQLLISGIKPLNGC